ncbi:MAG: hypothetical protein AAGE94_16620, partial [Acidobacteriota bacterium]
YDGYCTAEDQKEAESKVGRRFVDLLKFHHQLDETVEVSGEALEPDSVLCQGHSTSCGAHGQAVGPRVWKGKPDSPDARPVYYEVKVNYDFFEYVLGLSSIAPQPPLYVDSNAVTHALLGEVQLPVRAAYTKSSKTAPTQNPGITDTPYSTQACLSRYADPTAQTPCNIGSVHTKSAWIQLESGDDPSNYHTTRAIYYEEAPVPDAKASSGDTDPPICKAVGTFGMVGLHIIQRVHIDHDKSPIGGAFIFATWEHEEVIPDHGQSEYHYVNYLVPAETDTDHLVPYPTLDHAIRVSRLLLDPQPPKPADCTLSQGQTCVVNDLVHEKVRGTVWENYRLIGTQFASLGSKADSNKIAQPYYLANGAIETNQGLQQFQGLPSLQPRFHPPQWCLEAPKPCDAAGNRKVKSNNAFGFARGDANMVFGGAAHNMGGCMGCHGVAQQNGYSFSFVLLGGQRGADADTEATENVPPPKLTHSSDLYLQSATAGGSNHPVLGVLLSPGGPILQVQPLGGGSEPTAQEWQIVPYYKDPAEAIFGGTFVVQTSKLGESAVLTAGQAIGDAVTVSQLLPRPGGIGPSAPLSQSWKLISLGTASDLVFYLQSVETGGVLTITDGGLTTQKADGQPIQGWTLQFPPPPPAEVDGSKTGP